MFWKNIFLNEKRYKPWLTAIIILLCLPIVKLVFTESYKNANNKDFNSIYETGFYSEISFIEHKNRRIYFKVNNENQLYRLPRYYWSDKRLKNYSFDDMARIGDVLKKAPNSSTFELIIKDNSISDLENHDQTLFRIIGQKRRFRISVMSI
jgi:hypothetical protein